jgi:hypothetical protein
VCGNDVIEGDEVCDGSDLGGETCQSQGFDGGTLACNGDCQGFDTSGCTTGTCLPAGSSCSSHGDCCSNKCTGSRSGKVCR